MNTRVKVKRNNRDKAELDAWTALSANCPWRSEKHFREEERRPGKCLAVRQSAWLQECSRDKCAPYYFSIGTQRHE